MGISRVASHLSDRRGVAEMYDEGRMDLCHR